MRLCCSFFTCFNTQPTEGGWPKNGTPESKFIVFQHTAARRRLEHRFGVQASERMFQHTAARRRLVPRHSLLGLMLCFNTQPPEGGWLFQFIPCGSLLLFQHTAARRRLAVFNAACMAATLFQHTAARRRLGNVQARRIARRSFNTQPPEGGWSCCIASCLSSMTFQHTAARRRLVSTKPVNMW